MCTGTGKVALSLFRWIPGDLKESGILPTSFFQCESWLASFPVTHQVHVCILFVVSMINWYRYWSGRSTTVALETPLAVRLYEKVPSLQIAAFDKIVSSLLVDLHWDVGFPFMTCIVSIPSKY